MKKVKRTLASIIISLIFLFCLFPYHSYAGGPLIVKNGKVVSYGTDPLIYRYDTGKLGLLSNTDAVSLVEGLFSIWENVKTASFKFQPHGQKFLDTEVDGNNFQEFLESRNFLGYTPIVFDDDGSIVEAIFGKGSKNDVIGFATPIFSTKGKVSESQIVLNGIFVNGIDTNSDLELTLDTMKVAVVHEIGHGIGLDHSQINVDVFEDIFATQEERNTVPLMFPIALNDKVSLKQDDISSISLLYPNQTELASFGKIEGKLLNEDGITPLKGANVIARNINNTKIVAVSCVSDYLLDNTGSFILEGVPPGDYILEIEPINKAFTGGSGVGPYSSNELDLSFQQLIPKGFYTGDNLPLTTNVNQAKVMTISSGQTVNANIIASFTVTIKETPTPESTPTPSTTPGTQEESLITLPQQVSISIVGAERNSLGFSIPVNQNEGISKLDSAMTNIFGTYALAGKNINVIRTVGAFPEVFNVSASLSGVSLGDSSFTIGDIVDKEEGNPLLDITASANASKITVLPSNIFSEVSELEPNDLETQAQHISPPVIVKGFIDSLDESGKIEIIFGTTGNITLLNDIYKITISNTSILSASLLTKSTLITDDIDLFLLDQSGNKVLGKSVEPRNSAEFISSILQPGDYLVGVGAISGKVEYELTVHTSPLGLNPTLDIPRRIGLPLISPVKNSTNLFVRSYNFFTPTSCSVLPDTSIIKAKPPRFKIGGKKVLKVISLTSSSNNLFSSPRYLKVRIFCANGVTEHTDVLLIPLTLLEAIDQ